MGLVLKNNAVSRLASSLEVGDTTVAVTASEGSRFPVLAPGDWFPVTVLRGDGTLEIMRCTARSGDLLTVARAQESTTAKTFNAGDRVELRLTAATFDTLVSEVQQQVDSLISEAQQQVDSFIPDYAGNAGKALVVNAGETAAEWQSVSTPLSPLHAVALSL